MQVRQGPFGGPCEALLALDDEMEAEAAMEFAATRLQSLKQGGAGGVRLYRPPPTAAFTGSETRLSGFDAAQAAVREFGFQPLVRQPGGHLAIYDRNSLILDIVAPHDEPRMDMMARFEGLAQMLCEVFRAFDIDAEVGPVPGEFCSGKYSVNDGGLRKLAGLAQRISRNGYHLSALMLISPSLACDQALAQAYHHLGLEFDPQSQGEIAANAKNFSVSELSEMLMIHAMNLVQSRLG